MSTSRKFLIFAAGLALSVLLVTTVYSAYHGGEEVWRTGNEMVTENASIIVTPELLVYEDSTLSGSDVFTLLKCFPECEYRIITKLCSEGFSASEISNDGNSKYYVNPAENYVVKFVYDTTDSVKRILVVQQGCSMEDALVEDSTPTVALDASLEEAVLYNLMLQYSKTESQRKLLELKLNGGVAKSDIMQLKEMITALEEENREKESQLLNTK